MRAVGLSALAAGVLVIAGCQSDGEERSATNTVSAPYAGLEKREIRALSEKEIEDLLAGRGMGYALAAELNHYPGPLHALELAEELGLSAEQLEATRRIRREMLAEARPLGRQLVSLEAELDRAFRSAAIDRAKLHRLTQAIGRVEARLRATHLEAHLKLRRVFTKEQIARYDELRGYAKTGAGGTEREPGMDHEPGMEHDSQSG